MKTIHLLLRLLSIRVLVLPISVFAVTPPPQGDYPTENTALGEDALFSLPADAFGRNTAIGFKTLYKNTYGSGSVAIGASALFSNTLGEGETAVGYLALYSNTTGDANVAVGSGALYSNSTGLSNVGVGSSAIGNNTSGNYNTAVGDVALTFSTTGSYNTALGAKAIAFNSTGHDNAAVGYGALNKNSTGINNVGVGSNAGAALTTGSNNIVLGYFGGSALTTGSNNIEIGHVGGSASESGTIRIGSAGAQTATFVAGIRNSPLATGVAVGISPDGQLGVRASSARFKEAIKPMDRASEVLLALQPVTFRYKKEIDPAALPQFGLVAEEVAKVDPDLVARDAAGKPFTVRYEEVNAMLLNEFLKEHRKVEEQAAINQRQEATIVRLEAALREQAGQIEKVSAQLAAQRPAPRVVKN